MTSPHRGGRPGSPPATGGKPKAAPITGHSSCADTLHKCWSEVQFSVKYYKTYRVKTVPREHRSMQRPEVNTSVINNEVTFTKPDALGSSELHKGAVESIL